MVTNVLMKFGWAPMKIVGKIALPAEIPAAYGPVLKKNQNVIFLFIF